MFLHEGKTTKGQRRKSVGTKERKKYMKTNIKGKSNFIVSTYATKVFLKQSNVYVDIEEDFPNYGNLEYLSAGDFKNTFVLRWSADK